MGRKRSITGIFLIMGGILVALGNFNMIKELVVLPIISLGFLFVYFYLGAWKRRGNIGFLIPGVIVGIVGVYSILDSGGYIPVGSESIFLLMLGIGFLLIMVIHTIRIEGAIWGERYWPVFPSCVLLTIGSIGLITEENSTMTGLIMPTFLILIGVYILLKPLIKGRPRYKHYGNENKKDKI